MPEPLEFEIVVNSRGQATTKKVADDTERAAKATKEQKKDKADLDKAMKFSMGPNQRLIKFEEELGRAKKQNNKAAIADIERAINLQKRQLYNATYTKRNLGGMNLLEMVATSIGARGASGAPAAVSKAISAISHGGGGSALASGAAAAAGSGAEGIEASAAVAAATDPLVAIALAIAAAGVAFIASVVAMTKATVESANEMTAFRFSTGASGLSAAHLTTMGSALGLSPSQMSGISGAFQSDVSGGNPFTMEAAQKFGVRNNPRPFGDTDEAQNLAKAAEYLRTLGTFGEKVDAIRRMPALEPLLPYSLLSDKTVGQLGGDEGLRTKVFDEQTQANAAEFTAQMGRLAQALSTLAAEASKDLIPFLSGVAESLTWLANAATTFLDAIPDWVKSAMTLGVLPQNPHLSADQATTAQDRNTDAVNANTTAIKEIVTMFGEGERFNASIPSSMHGDYLRRTLAMEGAAMQFSEF